MSDSAIMRSLTLLADLWTDSRIGGWINGLVYSATQELLPTARNIIGSMPERYILDTNAILDNPEVLALSAGKRVIIPQAVMDELGQARMRGARDGLRGSLNSALRKGAHIARDPDASAIAKIVSDPRARGLAGADLSIAALAIDYAARMGPSAVAVVTRDRGLSSFLSSHGISSRPPVEFLKDPSLGQPDKEIQSHTQVLLYRRWAYVLLSAVFGFAGSLLGNFAYSHLRYLAQTFHIWGVSIAVFLVGIFLYWVRERFRLGYGVFESAIGVIMASASVPAGFDYSQLNVTFGIRILSGLYVIVRGLDNIGKGSEGTTIAPYWKRIFLPQDSDSETPQ